MAISIDWGTKVISIPKADLLLIQSSPTEIRQLDIDSFRLELKDLEDSEDGMPFETTHNHNPPVTVGGVTLARVVEIINGYTITFEDGQYAVNLVGANSNIGDVTNVNQVSVRSANSAGLTFSKQVEDSSFHDARVWINTNTGLSGTSYPRGTVADPVDNLADAETIITIRNLPRRLRLRGLLTLAATDNLDGYDVQGASVETTSITSVSGASLEESILSSMELIGPLGHIESKGCWLTNVSNLSGTQTHGGLSGTITLGSGGDEWDFIDCYSRQPGTGKPILDCNDIVNVGVNIRRYAGGLEVRNFSDAGSTMTIDLVSGNILLDSTCTGGTVVVRGTGTLTDNSGVGCTVVRTGLVAGEEIQLSNKLLRNKYITDPGTGVATLYDDDGSVLYTGNLFEDAAGTQAYRGQGAERRERLE